MNMEISSFEGVACMAKNYTFTCQIEKIFLKGMDVSSNLFILHLFLNFLSNLKTFHKSIT